MQGARTKSGVQELSAWTACPLMAIIRGPSTFAMQPQGNGFNDPASLVNNPFLDDVFGLNGSGEGDHEFVGAMGGNGGFAGTGYYDPQWGPAYPQGHYNF